MFIAEEVPIELDQIVSGGESLTIQSDGSITDSSGATIETTSFQRYHYRLAAYTDVGWATWHVVGIASSRGGDHQGNGAEFVLNVREHIGTDPACCPSREGTIAYRLEEGHLHEVQSAKR
jgi:hypothetical protein